jgi:RNA polymerase sigma-70 factor (ECF subfamily)
MQTRNERCAVPRISCSLVQASLAGRSLEDAMESFMAGDESAFIRVYRLTMPRVYGMLVRLTKEPALSEDLAQETMLRMYRAGSAFRRGAKVLPWAYTIARRLFVDRIRRQRHEQAAGQHFAWTQPDFGAARPDDELAARRVAAVVGEVLDRLPPRQAQAFRLVKEEGLSLSDASEQLGDSNASVRIRTHRACQAIREALQDYGYFPARDREMARAS